MNKLNPVLAKLFAAFELILAFFIINATVVIFSIISLFLLYPVLISGIFYILRKIIKHKEYESIIFDYFRFVRKNIIKSLMVGILPLIISIIIVLTVFLVNPMMVEITSMDLVMGIQVVQLIVLYILFSVLSISLIQIAHSIKKDNMIVLRDSFLIFFAKPLRPIIAFASIFIFGYYLYNFIEIYFIVFSIPILYSLYYIIIYPNIDKYDNML